MESLVESATQQKRLVWSWAFYDWANSAFATTVIAGFFPLFFKQYWSSGFSSTQSTYVLGITNSLASFSLALLLPILGAIADAGGKRKRFLGFFTLVGAGASVALCFLGPGQWEWAAALFAIGLIGFSGALPFYDALLLNVTSSRHFDRVSGLGYAMGYLGGGVLFAANVWMYLHWGADGVRYSFLTVGCWWLLFSLPLFKFVPEDKCNSKMGLKATIQLGLSQLWSHILKLKRERALLLFLVGYLFYIDGVNTIIKMAVDYGLSIGLEPTDLIKALLLVQFVGFPAAVIFGFLGERFSPLLGIWICLFIYLGVTVYAYNLHTSFQFFILAAVIGLVQGGIQSLSRSYFARLVPKQESAQYFGFFNMIGKFSAILGPLLVAQVGYSLDSSRAGILVLVIVFVVGGALLYSSSRASPRLQN